MYGISRYLLASYHTGVGYCLFAFRLSRASVQINGMLHTFFCVKAVSGARTGMKLMKRILVLLVAVCALFVSCQPEIEPIPVTGVSLSSTSIELTVGESMTINATISPDNADNKRVTWSSNNPSIASVSGGCISAVSPGNVTITVTTVDGGKNASCSVYVKPKSVAVTGISLVATTYSLNEGDSFNLQAKVSPSNASNQLISFSTSNSSVATVNSSGIVTAVGAGSATITAKTSDQGKTAICQVTVIAKSVPVSSVSLSQTSLSLMSGTSVTIEAIIKPDNATNKQVNWSTSNSSIATVSNGLITAQKEGTCVITAIVDGKESTCAVSVIAPDSRRFDYFTIEALSDGVIGLSRRDYKWIGGNNNGHYALITNYYHGDMEFSSDGGTTWKKVADSYFVDDEYYDDNVSNRNYCFVSVKSGDKIIFKANESNYCDILDASIPNYDTFTVFESSCLVNISGNILSLIEKESFPLMTSFKMVEGYNIIPSIFGRLFSSLRVVSAKDLILPLDTIPFCYYRMFYQNKTLRIAPELPALYYNSGAYKEMFDGCSNLHYVKCLALAPISSLLTEVSGKGTFVKNPKTTWPSEDIPKGWTVHNGDGPVPRVCIGYDNNHEWIDLGLPSGTLWSRENLGASEWRGLKGILDWRETYYSWGETDPKNDNVSWENYKWYNSSNKSLTKYCSNSTYGKVDNKTILDLSDDAANHNWGGNWHIPSLKEWDELFSECDIYTIGYEDSDILDLDAIKLVSKTTGEIITLYVTKYYQYINPYGEILDKRSPNACQPIGCYWTSNVDDKDYLARGIVFKLGSFNNSHLSYGSSLSVTSASIERYMRLSIRPVTKK